MQALRKRPSRPRHRRRSPAAGSPRLDSGAVPPRSVGRGSDCAPRGAEGRASGGQLELRRYPRLGSARLGSARLGSARLGSARLGSARLGSARLGSARLGSARLGSARLGSARLGSARLGSARLGSARLGSARLGSARLGSARLGSARLGSARLGSARLGSARLGSARLGSARLGSARLIIPLAASSCTSAVKNIASPLHDCLRGYRRTHAALGHRRELDNPMFPSHRAPSVRDYQFVLPTIQNIGIECRNPDVKLILFITWTNSSGTIRPRRGERRPMPDRDRGAVLAAYCLPGTTPPAFPHRRRAEQTPGCRAAARGLLGATRRSGTPGKICRARLCGRERSIPSPASGASTMNSTRPASDSESPRISSGDALPRMEGALPGAARRTGPSAGVPP